MYLNNPKGFGICLYLNLFEIKIKPIEKNIIPFIFYIQTKYFFLKIFKKQSIHNKKNPLVFKLKVLRVHMFIYVYTFYVLNKSST